MPLETICRELKTDVSPILTSLVSEIEQRFITIEGIFRSALKSHADIYKKLML